MEYGIGADPKPREISESCRSWIHSASLFLAKLRGRSSMSARAWYLHYVYCQLWKLGRHHPECWTIQLIDLIRSRFIHISRWPPGISVRDPGSKYFSSILLLKLLHCGFG